MLKRGDKFKFTCLGIIEATPDFTYYRVKEDNGDTREYLEKHTEPYIQKNTECEATVIKRTLFKDIKVVTVLKVNSISDDSINSRVMYRAEQVGVFDPILLRLRNIFLGFKKKKYVH